MAYDLTGDKVEIAPVEFKKIQQTIKDVVGNVELVSAGHNKLVVDVQTDLNDLQGQVDKLTTLTSEEVDAIESKIKTLNEVLGTAEDEVDFVDVIDVVNKLVDDVNGRSNNVVSQFRFNANGVLDVDLSAFGFSNVSEYQIMTTLSGGIMAPVTLTTQKVDEKTAKVYARDLRYFAELNQAYTDAGVKETDADGNDTYPNAFDVTILVSFISNAANSVKKVGRVPTAA